MNLCRWRLALPFYNRLPVPEVLRVHKNIRIMDDVVNKIIVEKRNLISRGEGEISVECFIHCLCQCVEESTGNDEYEFTNK